MYLHCLIPQKLGVLQRYFYLLQFEKERNHFALPFFFCSKATRFFFGFFWLPPGSEIQQNIQANASDCECFMGLCDRWGGGKSQATSLFGCGPSQDVSDPRIITFVVGDFYINLHLPLHCYWGRDPHPTYLSNKKVFEQKICLLVHDPLYTPEIQP